MGAGVRRAGHSPAGVEVPGQSDAGFHIHAMLRVYVDGKPVTVPANVGIDPQGQFIAPLHTHDTSGVIHMEATQTYPFTLGQFFTVWGVKFAPGQLGAYRTGGGKTVAVSSTESPWPTPPPTCSMPMTQSSSPTANPARFPPSTRPPSPPACQLSSAMLVFAALFSFSGMASRSYPRLGHRYCSPGRGGRGAGR